MAKRHTKGRQVWLVRDDKGYRIQGTGGSELAGPFCDDWVMATGLELEKGQRCLIKLSVEANEAQGIPEPKPLHAEVDFSSLEHRVARQMSDALLSGLSNPISRILSRDEDGRTVTARFPGGPVEGGPHIVGHSNDLIIADDPHEIPTDRQISIPVTVPGRISWGRFIGVDASAYGEDGTAELQVTLGDGTRHFLVVNRDGDVIREMGSEMPPPSPGIRRTTEQQREAVAAAFSGVQRSLQRTANQVRQANEQLSRVPPHLLGEDDGNEE